MLHEAIVGRGGLSLFHRIEPLLWHSSCCDVWNRVHSREQKEDADCAHRGDSREWANWHAVYPVDAFWKLFRNISEAKLVGIGFSLDA